MSPQETDGWAGMCPHACCAGVIATWHQRRGPASRQQHYRVLARWAVLDIAVGDVVGNTDLKVKCWPPSLCMARRWIQAPAQAQAHEDGVSVFINELRNPQA